MSIKALRRVRRIVSNGWCKDAEARTARGIQVPVYSPQATRFDLATACALAARTGDEYESLLTVLAQVQGDHRRYPHARLVDFNDNPNTKRRDVLKLIDDTIDRLEKSNG